MVVYIVIAVDKLNKLEFVTYTTKYYDKAVKISKQRSCRSILCKIVSSTLEKE